MKKLRLLLFEECDRNCSGCCNNDWDLNDLEVCESFEDYDEVSLTGGEPMLWPDIVIDAAYKIRNTCNAKIWLYTAKVSNLYAAIQVFWVVDGMCITLHEQSDVESWRRFSDLLSDGKFYRGKSMRLNVFKSVDVQNIPSWWKVKSDIEWIPNAPLPENESFMRYQKQRSERNGNSGYTGV